MVLWQRGKQGKQNMKSSIITALECRFRIEYTLANRKGCLHQEDPDSSKRKKHKNQYSKMVGKLIKILISILTKSKGPFTTLDASSARLSVLSITLLTLEWVQTAAVAFRVTFLILERPLNKRLTNNSLFMNQAT